LSLDEAKAEDRVKMINTIKVAIDPKIESLTTDLMLDIQDGLQGKGLVLLGMKDSDCC
jgi:Fe-S cluster assembly iron-binding protein IscA